MIFFFLFMLTIWDFKHEEFKTIFSFLLKLILSKIPLPLHTLCSLRVDYFSFVAMWAVRTASEQSSSKNMEALICFNGFFLHWFESSITQVKRIWIQWISSRQHTHKRIKKKREREFISSFIQHVKEHISYM